MAIAFKDRVKTECTTIGTGDIVFGATRHGFQDWSKVPNGEKVYYCLLNVDEWEVGYGIKSTGGIQRNVLDSTTGSKISLTGGADVFLTYPADGVVAKDESGNLIIDGTITATEVYADNLTLEGLGLANHEKIIVDTNGVISGDGGGLTNLNIDLADNGLANHDKITVDELGNLGANSISIDTSLGYPNNWSVTGQPTSFNVSQSGATKASVGSDGKLTATGFVGDGSELTGLNIPEALPDQTGQNGKYLQTDGAVATWQEVVGGGESTVADGCIYLNNQVITSDYVFPLGKNGMSGGPISIDGSVEVGDGTWTIVGEGGETATLESLGIPNHDKVIVDGTGGIGMNLGANPLSGYGDGKLHLHAPSNNMIHMTTDTSGTTSDDGFDILMQNQDAQLINRENGSVSVFTNNAQRMKIDADGTVNIPSPSTNSNQSQYGLSIRHACPNISASNASLKVFSTHGSNHDILLADFANGTKTVFKVATSGRVDIDGSLYVNGSPKSLDAMVADVETKLADRDKLIDKLMARIETLEKKVK